MRSMPSSTTMAVFFAIWAVLVTASDNILKPLLLGRGMKIPMLVILVGAIGGLLRAGLVGLFIGPVVLTVFYELFTAWVKSDAPAGETPGETAPAKPAA